MALVGCAECGSQISDKAPSCPRCGAPNATYAAPADAKLSQPPPLFAQAADSSSSLEFPKLDATSIRRPKVSAKSYTAAALWCFFLGTLGAHRFYVGKVATGFLMLFTLGLGGIWALIDFFRILFGNFTDKEGLPIVQGGTDSRNNSSSTHYGTAQPRNGVGMWVLGGIVVLVVLGGVGYAVREGGLSSGGAQSNVSAEDSALPTVGDVVRIGDFDVRIDAVQPKDSVGMIFGGESAPPGTVYVVVNYSYTNRSAEPKEFFEKPSVVLVDASGRKMASDGGARALVGADQDFSAGLMNAINPGVTHDDGEVFQVSRAAFDATTWTVKIEVDWHSQVVVLARAPATAKANTPNTVSTELPPPPHAPPTHANAATSAMDSNIASNAKETSMVIGGRKLTLREEMNGPYSLLLDDEVTLYQDEHELFGVESLQEKVGLPYALIYEYSGGTACPMQLRLLDLGNEQPSTGPKFGTCSDIVEVSLADDGLHLTQPLKGGKRTYIYRNGVLNMHDAYY